MSFNVLPLAKTIDSIINIVIDYDLHFMLNIPDREHPICFDFDGRSNSVIQLAQDDKLGNFKSYIVTYIS